MTLLLCIDEFIYQIKGLIDRIRLDSGTDIQSEVCNKALESQDFCLLESTGGDNGLLAQEDKVVQKKQQADLQAFANWMPPMLPAQHSQRPLKTVR